MSLVGSVAAGAFVVFAVTDWFAVAGRLDRQIRWVAKPGVMLAALAAVGVDGDTLDGSVQALILGAFAFSLAGDVFLLLDGRRFMAGLASFLVGHLLFVGAFLAIDAGVSLLAAALIVVVPFGARIVTGARKRHRTLGVAVVGYLVAISAMFVTATGTGERWLVFGAALFVASDTMLGWNRFVRPGRWLPVGVIVTYHLAQGCFALYATG